MPHFLLTQRTWNHFVSENIPPLRRSLENYSNREGRGSGKLSWNFLQGRGEGVLTTKTLLEGGIDIFRNTHLKCNIVLLLKMVY